jgi:hypothetical protein
MKSMEEITKENEDHYKLTNGIFSVFEFRITVDIPRVRFPYTASALYYCAKKIDAIIDIILQKNKKEEYYITNLLIRSLFEHFLIGHYIATRSRLERSDKVGKEYYTEFYTSEDIRRRYKKIKINAVRDNRQEKLIYLEEFNRIYETNYTQKYFSDIHTIANKFDPERIIKYIMHEIPEEDSYNYFNKTIHPLLDAYNVSSSYIHGGPSAEQEHFRPDADFKEKKKRMLQISINLSKMGCFSIKEAIFDVMRKDIPEYQYIFVPLQQLGIYYDWR